MENLATLTVKEVSVLESILESQYQSCDSDNEGVIGAAMYQWDVLDYAEGVGAKGFSGVVSSLNKKGLVTSDSTGHKDDQTITITKLGFDSYWNHVK